MKSWIWPLVDPGVNRKASTAGRQAIPDHRLGVDRQASHGGGRVTCTTTRAPTPIQGPIPTHGLTPTRGLTRIVDRGA
jgi:hypothetical protein